QVGSMVDGSLIRKMTSAKDLQRFLGETVESVMDGPLPTVGDDADVDVVYRLLEHEPAVLVVSHGRVAGIIAKADLFKLAGSPKK
ncbi:MAG: CBS domain-containing protein, partial [Candidatus Hadarchaeales archaeon]